MFIVLLTIILTASNHTKCVSLSNQICKIQSIVKNYTTIHLQLNKTNVLESVIHLMTYLLKYVFQIKLKIKYTCF